MFAFVLALMPFMAHAQLAQRHSFNVRGDVEMVGNALLTCSGTGCASQQAGTTDGGNASRQMVYVNIDGAALPFGVPENSSRADLALPAGSTVLSAGLYWGGRAGYSDGNRGTIYLRVPGSGSYQPITASAADVNTFMGQGESDANRPYTAHADVTSLVRSAGSGSYYAGGLTSTTGGTTSPLGFYGGWALIVLYENDGKPFRRLMVFDGNAGYVASGGTQTVTIDGLLTPVSGDFDAYMGALVWEGDQNILGDQFRLTGAGVLDGGALSDAQSPSNNFWNSGISRLGTRFSAKSPDYVNHFAVDLKLVDISNTPANVGKPRMANGATGADLTFTTNQDAYFPHALVFVSNLYVPDLVTSLQKTVTNITNPGGPLQPEDILEYTIVFENTGQDGATFVVMTDVIPTHTTYVPGTLVIVDDDGRGIAGNTVPSTDAPGDDQAEYDAVNNRVVFRVGNGANAVQGGLLQFNEGVRLRFRVQVDASAPGGTVIHNVAGVEHNAETAPLPNNLTGTTTADIGPVANPPKLEIAKSGPATAVVGVAYDYTLTVSNTGTATTADATVTDTVPAGLTINSAGPGCSISGQDVSCTVASGLAAGANTVFTINVTPTAAAGGSVTNTASVSGGGDPDCTTGCDSPPVVTTLNAPK
ncbi:hypothetical protein, partial [Luteimonas sp. e5]